MYMINVAGRFLLIVALICLSHVGLSQSNEIRIKFIGNCGLYLTDGNANLYIDFPYKSGAHGYMKYDRKEIDSIQANSAFLFTHRHADHYSKKIVKKFNGKKFGPWNIGELGKLAEAIPDFEIKAFKTRHKVYGISFKHYSYLITWHHKNIFISGDTENADTIALQKELDWAFVPVWLLIDAKNKGINLSSLSKMYVIYHIGPKDKITSDGKDPQLRLLNKQGERITIPY